MEGPHTDNLFVFPCFLPSVSPLSSHCFINPVIVLGLILLVEGVSKTRRIRCGSSFSQNDMSEAEENQTQTLSSTGTNFWTLEGKILFNVFREKLLRFRVPQKPRSRGTVGIRVEYLVVKLLTVGKKNQLQELGFILNLTVLVWLSELVIQTHVRWITVRKALYNCNYFF